MIILKDYVEHWKIHYPQLVGQVHPEIELTPELLRNADTLLRDVNYLLLEYGKPCIISSGWRPQLVNACIPNAAKLSNHITCQAIDLEDIDGLLDTWCMNNTPAMIQYGLWQEHPSATKGWCHLQSRPYASYKEGKPRWFYP